MSWSSSSCFLHIVLLLNTNTSLHCFCLRFNKSFSQFVYMWDWRSVWQWECPFLIISECSYALIWSWSCELVHGQCNAHIRQWCQFDSVNLQSLVHVIVVLNTWHSLNDHGVKHERHVFMLLTMKRKQWRSVSSILCCKMQVSSSGQRRSECESESIVRKSRTEWLDKISIRLYRVFIVSMSFGVAWLKCTKEVEVKWWH